MAIGGLVGLIIGVFVATKYFALVAGSFGGEAWTLPVAFFVLFFLTSYAVGLVFWVANKIFNIVSIIPFAKTVNRLLGAAFGFLQGVFLMSVALYVLDRYFFFIDVENIFGGSQAAGAFTAVGRIMSPLMPSLLSEIELFLK